MKKIMKKISLILLCVCVCCGCKIIMDPFGTSLDDVYKAKQKNTAKGVFAGNLSEIRDRIRDISEKQKWLIFQDLPEKECFVLMKIPNAVDTTEVGVFITNAGDTKVEIEVCSLNRKAQEKVSTIIFEQLQ